MVVKPSTQAIRPYVVCAVLRDVTFTPARYASFIDLQDKLHNNICRKRTLVAIGTHDLDSLSGTTFTYEALPPTEIEFVPLSQTQAFRADKLMDFYRTDPSVKHIKPYVDILAGSPVYPAIFDSKRTLLSLPPIINGEHSKISLETKNVFVECTATDLHKANMVLNTMVTMFSEYCAKPFTVESVKVTYEEEYKAAGKGYTSPDLSYRVTEASTRTIFGTMGIDIGAEKAASLLSRMQLEASVVRGGEAIQVAVPPTRPDVLHECDVAEDVAIAFGYNNIPRTMPKTATEGAQLPINKLSDQLRVELAAAGYNETLTLALVSREDNFQHMLLPDGTAITAVELSNPQTEDFQVGRTRMVPGLLKSLASNRGGSIKDGVKLFEVSDVLLLDPSTDVGARNERHLAGVYSGPSAGFEVIHGLVDRVMQLLEIPVRPYKWEADANGGVAPAGKFGRGGFRYFVERDDSVPSYFPGRGARIVLEKADGTQLVVGGMGVLHPLVLKNFELSYPASVMELNIEPFLL
jgi:phenylalanyl-tRNA synthetase beta chain